MNSFEKTIRGIGYVVWNVSKYIWLTMNFKFHSGEILSINLNNLYIPETVDLQFSEDIT